MDNKDNKNINKDRYTKSKIYFEEGENYNLPKESKVQVVDCGNKIIIKHSWRNSNNLKKYIRKDKNHYMDIDTGEIMEYSKNSPYKTKKEIVKAMKYLRELIQANFKGNFNELFITVTCRNEVTDIRKIKRYAKYFIKKLKKKYPEKQFEYIYKFERQENQNWHIHFLIKDIKNKQLYIPNENIETIWNRGFTKTQRVYDGSSTEERLLTQEDEELLSEEDATTNEALKSIKATGKSVIANYMSKTSQLNDFPRGERIYVKSQGIIPPHKTNMKYKDAIDKIRNGKYYFMKEKTIIVKSSQNDKIINTHKIEEYKKLY